MSKRINNVRNEIKEFIKDFCLKVDIDTDTSSEDCFVYESVMYYIPEETSLMGEDDALLAKMLLATFNPDL